MMGWMTYGNVKFHDLDSQIRPLIKPLYEATQKLEYRIDADTDAFNDYMAAIRMPKKTEEEQSKRLAAMQEGLKVAIDVPLQTMKVRRGGSRRGGWGARDRTNPKITLPRRHADCRSLLGCHGGTR